MRKLAPGAVLAILATLAADRAAAQRGGGDWMTAANDAQRSSWVRNDAKISVESLRKPGFELVWKLKLENAARQLNTLTPPALLDFYIGYKGFRTLGFFGTSSNRIVGVDLDLARIEWQKNLAASGAAGTVPCPGGMTSAVTRPTSSAYPGPALPRGFGRGTGAKSGVGLPDEGAVTLRAAPQQPPPPPPRPPTPAPNAAAAAAPNPFAPRIQWVLGLTGDGKLHSLFVSNGDEPNPPIEFLPANANALGLVAYDNVAYAATAGGCGGVEDGVWALDLASKKVSRWKSTGAVAGTVGPAAGPDGTLYVAAGNELTALSAGALAPRASFRMEAAGFASSPVVFEFKGKDLIGVASSDGRVNVFDSAALAKGPLAQSPAFSAPGYAHGSIASWQDEAGTRWLLAAGSGNIAAWKVVDRNGAPALEAGWTSRELVSPLPPAIVAGVVFALSSGEFRTGDAKITAAQRAQRSSPAVLYALDGATGKELWNSGKTITSFVHSGGLSAGGSRVFVAGYDGWQYAFSFPMEH
jgi:outer membrane protein assembly factor BamB